MSAFSPQESALLDRIAIRQELERLTPLDRTLIELRFAYRIPSGYAGPWPPTSTSAGEYAGRRYLGRPLSATTVKERIQRVLEQWRRQYHDAPSIAPPARSPVQITTAPIRRAA